MVTMIISTQIQSIRVDDEGELIARTNDMNDRMDEWMNGRCVMHHIRQYIYISMAHDILYSATSQTE